MKRIASKNKKALSMALAAALAIAPVNALAASSDTYGHWAEKTINQWQDKGLISGYQDGTFKPDKAATRAEFARIMNQALGLNNKGSVSFSDVSANDWFYNDVAVAMGEAYTAGYPDGTFKPNETITRAQAAVFIANAIKASGGSVASFTDSANIPAWARDSIGAVVEKGYMSGYPDGTFKPNAVLTRAEAVSTLNRIMGNTTTEEEKTTTEKDVVIDKDDTKLSNQTIEGNLTISEKVGDGEVYLSNVEIKGDLIIQGGGDDSIYLDDTVVNGNTILDKKNVRLQVSGKTELSNVEIKKACNFSASNFSGEVKRVTVAEGISDKITIGVAADKLYVDKKATLVVTKEIGNVIIDKDAAGTKLEVADNGKVSTLSADGKVALSGKGTISTLEANVDDITYTSGLTISKTETAKGVDAPTKTTATSGGSSSSSSDSSSTKRSRSVSNAADFAAAIANDSLSTINVSGPISSSVVATRTGSRSLTINFGTYDVNGNLSITAPNVTAINLNDSAAGDAGAVVSSLTINAPNAEVTNKVKVTGVIDIKAVKLGTLNVNDAAGSIQMSGRGKINVASGITPPPVEVATTAPVEIAGTVGPVAVTTSGAQVTVSAGTTVSGMTVSGAGSVIIANASISGMTVSGGASTIIANAPISGMTVSGADSTITANVPISEIQTSRNITITGNGGVGAVNVIANGVAVTVNGAATVGNVNAVGVTGTTIGGTSTTKPATVVTTKAVAPTGLVGVAPTAANTDGKINHTTALMEYKLATAADTAYVVCSEGETVVAAGTYYVRVKAVGSVLASDAVQVVVPAYVAPVPVPVGSITVASAGDVTTITADKGTLQMSATVTPAEATNKAVTWTVTNTDNSVTDKATISATGLLTAAKDGDVKVVATANDGSGIVGNATITISGQVVFVGTTNNATANEETTLGLVGTTATSSADAVATVAIDAAKIAITSVSAGTATISVKDASDHEATIAVTVAANGAITIGTITKYDALATEVTASSNGIATATGETTITLGAAVSGLAAGDIVVKKGAATLVKDTDYTLSADLTGTTFVITFLANAALDNTSVVTVEMTKTGYVINGGNAIAVTNTIAAPATEVTASSNGIATATGETTITLGAAVSGLAAGDIVVKKGAATLVKDTDYTLSADLTGTTFAITFLANAALDNTSVVTVEMTKTGYVINGGNAIAVTNTIV